MYIITERFLRLIQCQPCVLTLFIERNAYYANLHCFLKVHSAE